MDRQQDQVEGSPEAEMVLPDVRQAVQVRTFHAILSILDIFNKPDCTTCCFLIGDGSKTYFSRGDPRNIFHLTDQFSVFLRAVLRQIGVRSWANFSKRGPIIIFINVYPT